MDAASGRRLLTENPDSHGEGRAAGPPDAPSEAIPRAAPPREYALSATALGLGLRRRLRRAGQTAWIVGRRGPHIQPGRGHLLLGDVRCSPGVELRCGPGGRLSVADGAQLGQNVLVYAACRVEVGRNARIAWDVVITDTPGLGRAARPVTVGEGAWIGAGAVLLGGASVGQGAVVGAGAVVSGDVPAGTVVPAGALAGDGPSS